MKKIILLAATLFLSTVAGAQDALVVTTCGTLPQAYAVGSSRLLTVDTTGKLCLSSSGGTGTANTWTALQTFTGGLTAPGSAGVSNQNEVIGAGAGAALTNGTINVIIGYNAGKVLNTSQENVFVGQSAGQSFVNTGVAAPDTGQNTFIGSFAGNSTTTGGSNTFIGQKAGESSVTGNTNVYVGAHAGDGMLKSDNIAIGVFSGGLASTTGGDNTIIGRSAAYYLQGTAATNVIIGNYAGAGTVGNPNTASDNVIIGYVAGSVNTSGLGNVFIGRDAGKANTSGAGGVHIGYQAGQATTGSSNVFIGYTAGKANITGLRNIYLGTNAGSTAPTNNANTFIAGATGNDFISNVYFGKGYADTSATGYTIRGTGGSGTDNIAAGITVSAGLSTGAANNPDIVLSTGVKIATGTGFATETMAVLIKGETQEVRLPKITTDATLTDTTVCQDTTNHGLHFGSGALGVCLGTSGRQFKTAFIPMVAGIDDLMKINFINYRYKNGWGDSGARMQYGTTAQDVEAAIPDIARHDANGVTINYDSGALLFIGLRAIQQLKAANDNLRSELELLKRVKAQ